jgi:hypothetical protein
LDGAVPTAGLGYDGAEAFADHWQFWAVLVWMNDRRGGFPMKNRFTVSRTGETSVL